MAESENKLDGNFLSSLSNGQSIESLVSAPLVAISNANAMMLSSQAQFVLDYGFKNNNGVYSPVMIKMEYTMGEHKEYFMLPLLTLIPMNNLAVDEVDVKFNLEITSTVSHISSKDENAINADVIQKKAKIGAKIGSSSNKRDESKSAGGIEVAIKSKQIPLTKGFNTILDLYSKNIITSKD